MADTARIPGAGDDRRAGSDLGKYLVNNRILANNPDLEEPLTSNDRF